MRKLVIRGVYLNQDLKDTDVQSFPLTEDGQKEALAITGKDKPDEYGLYELNYVGFLQWHKDYKTLEQAQEGLKLLNERS